MYNKVFVLHERCDGRAGVTANLTLINTFFLKQANFEFY